MSTADAAVAVARNEVGNKEYPSGSNRTKYGRWYGMDGQPWCAMFVSWVLAKSGIDGFRHAYTPTGVQLFKSAQRWHTWDTDPTGPEPGDVVFFDFPDSVYRVQHVGFAAAEYNRGSGTVRTIEGNTSQTSQDNGGEVQERVRPKSYIVGWGRPPYRKPPPVYKVRIRGKVKGKKKLARIKERLQMWGLRLTRKRRIR